MFLPHVELDAPLHVRHGLHRLPHRRERRPDRVVIFENLAVVAAALGFVLQRLRRLHCLRVIAASELNVPEVPQHLEPALRVAQAVGELQRRLIEPLHLGGARTFQRD